MRIGYIIPEFPSQTHVWIWREIVHVRSWEMPLTIFSTRRPSAGDRAKHAFADEAERETVYLWPRSPVAAFAAVLGALVRSPIGFFSCIRLAFILESLKNRGKKRPLLPLILPACVLAREVRRTKMDRLHSHSVARSAVLCMMVKRLTGVPYSLTLNADLTWWGGGVERKLAEADFTIAITQTLLGELRRQFPGIPEDRSLLGRIGVDTRRWRRPEGAASEPISDRPARIFSVGRLHPNKAFDVLMRAAKLLIERGRRVEVRIAGAGDEQTALESLRSELGLEDAVTLLGSQSEDEIIDELCAADVFSAVSRHEPLGVVYMEAMSLGVPTLGTTSGGVHEIIEDGVSGLLVEPDDPELLAEALERVLDDGELRARMGEAGRRAIVERFDSRLGAAVIYEKLMGRPAPLERETAGAAGGATP